MLSINQILFYNDGIADNRIRVPASSTSLVVPISVPKTGFIHRVAVNCITNPSLSFTVDLLWHDGSGSNPPPAPITKIIPSQSATGGVVFWNSDVGVPFKGVVQGANSTERYIYLKISLSAQASDTYFGAALVWRSVDVV